MSINIGQTYSETPAPYTRKSRQAVSVFGLCKAGIILFIIGYFSPLWLSLLSFLQPTPQVTVERLLEQARGDRFYWHANGNPWSTWEAFSTRHPKRRAREDAIKQLAKFKPLPVNARNELIALLHNSESDFDSGDGIYALRSTICYALGLSAHHWSANEAMLKLLRKRALDPKLDWESDIKWFDKSWRHYGGCYTGPSAIVRGLQFAPTDQHAEIAKRLEALLEELNSNPVHSDWAVSAIESGIEFFNDDSIDKTWRIELEIERYCVSCW